MQFNEKQLLEELHYKASLSSGPGGQHANKTSSKITLEWELKNTAVFKETQLELLQKRLAKYITKAGIFQLSSEETRSQHRNKEIVTQRFLKLIKKSLHRRKKRKKVKPGKKFHEKRLQEKKRKAEKKSNRKNPLL